MNAMKYNELGQTGPSLRTGARQVSPGMNCAWAAAFAYRKVND
jgi:hypothetical protein